MAGMPQVSGVPGVAAGGPDARLCEAGQIPLPGGGSAEGHRDSLQLLALEVELLQVHHSNATGVTTRCRQRQAESTSARVSPS